MTENGFFQRKFWGPLLGQLKQGTSPEKLAWSAAVGFTVSTCPLYGITTPLCALVGVVFSLNHVVLQLANYLATPIQIAAIPIFVKVGESVFGLPHMSFNLLRLVNEFRAAPILFFQTYGMNAAAATAVWIGMTPVSILLIRTLFLPVLRRKSR